MSEEYSNGSTPEQNSQQQSFYQQPQNAAQSSDQPTASYTQPMPTQPMSAQPAATQPMGAAQQQAYDQVMGRHAQAAQGYAQQGQAYGTTGQYAYSPAAQQAYAQQQYGANPAQPGPRPTKPAKAKSGGLGKTFLFGFLGALVACLIVCGVLFATGNLGSGSKTVIGSTGSSTITASEVSETLSEQVAAKCLPSVVSIDVYEKTSTSYNDLYQYYFGGSGSGSNGYGSNGYGYGYGSDGSNGSSSSDSSSLELSSLGSGIVISSDGYILTNYHVIESSDALKVTIEGTEYDATVVGSDESSDVAVIKVTNANGATFTPIEIGDSDNLTIGEWVMTIGSPFGLEQSVATGVVSATNRSQVYSDSSSSYYGTGSGTTTLYTNMIQTDAAINPGNSGGALVDADGKLIGMNTLITSYSGNYSGVGFAIPVNYAINLAQQIIDGKTPSHAQLGVSTTTISSSIAQRYGFSVSEGAYVSSVTSGSGAEAAGIQVGDIITKVDSTSISSASDLQLAVREKNIGDTVSITLNRNGETVNVTATLGSDSSTSTTTQNALSLLGGSNSGSTY